MSAQQPEANLIVIPGAGSSGITWQPLLATIDAGLLPVPDEDDVSTMAAALRPSIESVERPRILVGASLGAMVALEVARQTDVDGLVLLAAGFGIDVSDTLLQWVADGPPELFPKMARASLGDPTNEKHQAIAVEDFESRGQPVVYRHLDALSRYRPGPIESAPPTIVVWGDRDHSVPLRDHVELAMRCQGALVPVADAGHLPFLERPEEIRRVITWFIEWTL